jgi:signal transduction histidine kinase
VASNRPSDVRSLRAQLIQAEKLSSLGQIVAGVVHELANPITSIVACTDALLRRASTSRAQPEDVEQLKRIGVAADRILKFSRDLTAYARPATESPGLVALHEVVEQAHAFSEHELERSGVQFSTDFSEGAPPVMGQAGPLTQVFVNLFTNAAHAMSQHGGTLSVRTRIVEGERLLIEVTDTGVGIPEESLAKIFEPFFTTKEAGHGTGLGLSIVREIVEAHGGTVRAASTPGSGTTFVVGLPVRPRT